MEDGFSSPLMGNAGEYYAPRALTQFAVDMVDPNSARLCSTQRAARVDSAVFAGTCVPVQTSIDYLEIVTPKAIPVAITLAHYSAPTTRSPAKSAAVGWQSSIARPNG